jgi:hypothetical protein
VEVQVTRLVVVELEASRLDGFVPLHALPLGARLYRWVLGVPLFLFLFGHMDMVVRVSHCRTPGSLGWRTMLGLAGCSKRHTPAPELNGVGLNGVGLQRELACTAVPRFGGAALR